MIEHDQFLYPWGTPCLTQADVQLKHLQEITIGVSRIFSILLWAWEPKTQLQVDKLLWEVFGSHRFQHGTGALGLLILLETHWPLG